MPLGGDLSYANYRICLQSQPMYQVCSFTGSKDMLVGWSLTSLFSTNTVISETRLLKDTKGDFTSIWEMKVTKGRWKWYHLIDHVIWLPIFHGIPCSLWPFPRNGHLLVENSKFFIPSPLAPPLEWPHCIFSFSSRCYQDPWAIPPVVSLIAWYVQPFPDDLTVCEGRTD